MSDRLIDLKVNHGLLDPHFDGYKLSLAALPTYANELPEVVENVKMSETLFSIQHIKAFSAQNDLHYDPWSKSSVYYLDVNWQVNVVNCENLSTHLKTHVTFQLPDSSEQKAKKNRLHFCMQFASDDLVVLSDGAGKLYVCVTEDRERPEQQWKCQHRQQPLEGANFTIQYATSVKEQNQRTVHCVLLHIEDVPGESGDDREQTVTKTVVSWITLKTFDDVYWTVDRTRRLEGKMPPDFVAIDDGGTYVDIVADKSMRFVYDSQTPVTENTPKEDEDAPSKPVYTWCQDNEEVKVHFKLPVDTKKPDIECKISNTELEVKVNDLGTLLHGALHAPVNREHSTWTLSDHMLEVTLCKIHSSDTWPCVVTSDTRGQLVHDEAQVAAIHEQLAHLTSAELNPGPAPAGPGAQLPYNTQELEACDLQGEEAATVQRLHGDTHAVVHEVNIGGHQWLFNVRAEGDQTPSFALRHDVDGIVWCAEWGSAAGWKHVGTFNALGYVQASKTQRKFTVAAPDLSYAVIVDLTRHAYIYRQAKAISSPLRNRKTGRDVTSISEQQVVTLESTQQVTGAVATNDKLFVLAGNTLYVAKICSNDEL